MRRLTEEELLDWYEKKSSFDSGEGVMLLKELLKTFDVTTKDRRPKFSTRIKAKLLCSIVNMEFNDGCDWTVDGINLNTLKSELMEIARGERDSL